MSKFLFLILVVVSSSASAALPELAVGGGFIHNHPDIKITKASGVSQDEEDTTTFNIGVRAMFPIQEKLKYRTGLYLQEKSAKLEAEASGVSANGEAKILEVAIPLNVQYQLHEKFSAYGGYVVDLPINEYCKAGGVIKGCNVGEAAKVTHNLNIGGSFHLHEKIDLELSYQHPMKAVLDDTKIYAWLAQFFVKFP